MKTISDKKYLQHYGVTRQEYLSAEEVLLKIEVEYFDWLRCKGATPNVYNAIIRAMCNYKKLNIPYIENRCSCKNQERYINNEGKEICLNCFRNI